MVHLGRRCHGIVAGIRYTLKTVRNVSKLSGHVKASDKSWLSGKHPGSGMQVGRGRG